MNAYRLLMLAVGCLLSLLASAQPRYAVQLVLVNGLHSTAYGLNEIGTVVGEVTPQQEIEGFRWTNGQAEILKGTSMSNTRGASASAVNGLGVAVGNAGDNSYNSAAQWDGQGYHDLGTLGGGTADALSINDNGWIVGGSALGNGETRPFLYRNGHMQDLGTLGISGAIYGSADLIDSSGLIVGSDQTGSGDNHQTFGWTWTDATGMVQLPFSGEPPDLNDLGDMAAGKEIYNYYTHQFRTLPGANFILYINNTGGALGDGPNGVMSLWVGQTRYNLQDLLPTGSGYTIDHVIDINDRGQILAVVIKNGQYDSALLNPVPEPASIAALAGGLALLAGLRKRGH